MINPKNYPIRLLLFWFGVAILVANANGQPKIAEGLYVIVNTDNSIDRMSVNQLSRIFSKKTKKFPNEMASQPVAQKANREVTKIFNKVVMKKNERQLKYYWARKMFSGASKPPKSLASDMEVIKFVAGAKNAVGYVSQKPRDAKVKVIAIEP